MRLSSGQVAGATFLGAFTAGFATWVGVFWWVVREDDNSAWATFAYFTGATVGAVAALVASGVAAVVILVVLRAVRSPRRAAIHIWIGLAILLAGVALLILANSLGHTVIVTDPDGDPEPSFALSKAPLLTGLALLALGAALTPAFLVRWGVLRPARSTPPSP